MKLKIHVESTLGGCVRGVHYYYQTRICSCAMLKAPYSPHNGNCQSCFSWKTKPQHCCGNGILQLHFTKLASCLAGWFQVGRCSEVGTWSHFRLSTQCRLLCRFFVSAKLKSSIHPNLEHPDLKARKSCHWVLYRCLLITVDLITVCSDIQAVDSL